MPNQLLTRSEITNKALYVLENELTFAANVNREYDDRFAVAGAKIGYAVNVRKPARFKGTTGPALSVEDFNENSIPVTLTTQFHVDTQFTTADLATSLDMFTDRVIKPCMAAVANKIDADGFTVGYQNTANIVGTTGTPPSTVAPFLQAGAFLDSESTPRDGQRVVVMDPWTNASMSGALTGLFNPQSQISDVYRKGIIGKNTLGFDWYLDQNVAGYTVGAGGGSPVTTAGVTQSIASGWQYSLTLTTTGWSNSTQVLNVGDVFTIAGIYAVNPQNRTAYGNNKLRYFVVLPSNGVAYSTSGGLTSNGSGLVSVNIAPCPIHAGQFQNVSAAVTGSKALTIYGTASTVSPQNLAYHRNAFTLATADLELPEGVHFAARAASRHSGMSVRLVRQYTINNDSLPMRADVLYGWAPLYPETACRVAA